MTKNFILTALNILTAGLFFWVTFEPMAYLFYLGAALSFLSLMCWNPVGEFFIIRFVFRARRMRPEAMAAPAVTAYLGSEGPRQYASEKGYVVYYADSRVPYFLPVSRRRIVLSMALEGPLIRQGSHVLAQGVLPDAYVPTLVFSRRLLLLAILGDSIVLRIIELWAILFAFCVKVVFAIAMLIATGAIFEGPVAIWNALALGRLLGTIVVKINDIFNYIQDKLIEWLIKAVQAYSFSFLKEESAVYPVRRR